PAETITYSWDAVGNRVNMVDPDGGRFTYSYNAAERLTSLVNPWNERTTFTDDAAGRRILKKFANGTRTSFTYDIADYLTVLANMKSDISYISKFDYSYDTLGNPMHVIEVNADRVT